MCVRASTYGRVCMRAQGALEEHRDLSLDREGGGIAGGDEGLPRLKNREFTAFATKLQLRCSPSSLSLFLFPRSLGRFSFLYLAPIALSRRIC